jgi:hypothetical protein
LRDKKRRSEIKIKPKFGFWEYWLDIVAFLRSSSKPINSLADITWNKITKLNSRRKEWYSWLNYEDNR